MASQLPGGPASCANCEHWSEYTARLGECLEYVTRRQAAFARSTDIVAFHKEFPHRTAPDTAASHVCDRHQPSAEARRHG